MKLYSYLSTSTLSSHPEWPSNSSPSLIFRVVLTYRLSPQMVVDPTLSVCIGTIKLLILHPRGHGDITRCFIIILFFLSLLIVLISSRGLNAMSTGWCDVIVYVTWFLNVFFFQIIFVFNLWCHFFLLNLIIILFMAKLWKGRNGYIYIFLPKIFLYYIPVSKISLFIFDPFILIIVEFKSTVCEEENR